MSDYLDQFVWWSDDDVFRAVFGEHQPLIHSLPHLMLPAKKRSLEIVLRAIERMGAVWHDYPLFDKAGDPPDLRLSQHEVFRLWGLPANQELMWKHGWHAKLGSFTAILDLETSEDVLEKLNPFDPAATVYVEPDFPQVLDHLDQLRWAYIPLWDELPLVLFATRPEDGNWVKGVEQVARDEGLPYTRVVLEGGRQTWKLSPALRQLCRLEYGQLDS
ncbi:MAG: hypothetical protein K2X82_14565 [Gemmataceae bacterium]|nr:hypothetical protein [Gemmataceae bacterium]